MTEIELTAHRARRELGQMVGEASDDDMVISYARAVWSTLVEPGDGVAGALVAALGAPLALEVALSAGDRAIADAARAADLSLDALRAGRARWMPRIGAAPAALALSRRTGLHLLTPEDGRWPARAGVLGPHAPLCLWARGDVSLLGATAPAVALVGARAASSYGEQVASDLAAESAIAGVTVFSGAAYGIDGAAHSAALTAGGSTVAVMAGGLERTYPVGHIDLVERMARAGLVIAEMPCGTVPTKHRFLMRNRLIAAFSDATVVVEAGWRSGALNTANHALQIGRPLGVVPGPITSASSMGCHRLLRSSEAVCITGFSDVQELLGGMIAVTATAVGELTDADGRTDDRTRLLDAVGSRTGRATEDVARRAGFAVDEAAALLGLLELEGAVVRRGSGWVQAPRSGAATLW